MKQSKVFFNDETNENLQLLGVKNKTDKIKTASFVVEDYFTIIAKIKASIEETKDNACSYKKDEVLKVLKGLING